MDDEVLNIPNRTQSNFNTAIKERQSNFWPSIVAERKRIIRWTSHLTNRRYRYFRYEHAGIPYLASVFLYDGADYDWLNMQCTSQSQGTIWHQLTDDCLKHIQFMTSMFKAQVIPSPKSSHVGTNRISNGTLMIQPNFLMFLLL